jgi:hypothetical protein
MPRFDVPHRRLDLDHPGPVGDLPVSAGNADGNNVVTISIPADATVSYLRLDVSNNTVQGAPQIAEFEVFSS